MYSGIVLSKRFVQAEHIRTSPTNDFIRPTSRSIDSAFAGGNIRDNF